jgi:putative ubiquitin-RnfH superfamily antitoxin RatB of RatAB toxin-antitoxin module
MADGTIRVSIVFSPSAREVHEWRLDLRAGSTVADAVAASPLRTQFPSLEAGAMTVGVWGRRAPPGQVLRDRDRVEIYRPLQVDPKLARRERFRRQGARAAGLFARKP